VVKPPDIAVSPDSKSLVYSNSEYIYFYNLENDTLNKKYSIPTDLSCISFSLDGSYMAYILSDSTFHVFDLKENKLILNDKYKWSMPNYISLSFDGSLCAVSLSELKYHLELDIWDVNNIKKLRSYFDLGARTEFVNIENLILSFDDLEDRLALIDPEYEINDLNHKKIIKEFRYTYDFDFNPESQFLITDGPKIYRLKSQDSIDLSNSIKYFDRYHLTALSSNSKYIAAMSPEGRIVVWDVEQYLTPVEDYNNTLEQFSLSCYPNPADDELRIKINTEEYGEHNIFVYNARGIKLAHISWQGGSGSKDVNIDVSGYPSGLYFVKMQTGMFAEVKKIVVVH
ncbi:T9SS type A sorting domain-containing protein, partial [Bacteroidota bacterium]